jgi:hypothetical protein
VGYTIGMTMTQQDMKAIARRIAKASDNGIKIDQALGGENDTVRELITEDVVTNVLFELMECLKAGEDLAAAIETINSNF